MTPLLTTIEVAALFAVDERTIRRWVGDQLMPVVRVGRAGMMRFNPEQIAELLAGKPWVKPSSEATSDVDTIQEQPTHADDTAIFSTASRDDAPHESHSGVGSECRCEPRGIAAT